MDLGECGEALGEAEVEQRDGGRLQHAPARAVRDRRKRTFLSLPWPQKVATADQLGTRATVEAHPAQEQAVDDEQPDALAYVAGSIGLLPSQGAFAFYAGGEHLDAARAHELGLVHEVVAHERLMQAAEAWCEKIAALPEHALAMEEFAEPQCFTTSAFQDAVQGLLRRG